MPRAPWSLAAVLFASILAWAPALAQAVSDPGVLRFNHSLTLQREVFLVESRSEAAAHFLTAARELASLPQGSGYRKTGLLGDVKYLSDSIVLLDRAIVEAATDAEEARRVLITALETQAETMRRAAVDADSGQRAALGMLLENVESELEALQTLDDSSALVDPLSSAGPTLSALVLLVAEERVRLKTLARLQEELRIFLGNLRLFDETGLPPSVRAEAGGDPESPGGCGCALPPPPIASPADVPLEHFRADEANDRGRGGATSVSLVSLDQLQEHLASFRGVPEGSATNFGGIDEGIVTREITLGAAILSFRGEGDGLTAARLWAGSSLFLSRMLGTSVLLTVEPRLGGRVIQVDPSSRSAEVAGEVRGTLLGTVGSGSLRWQVSSWQKGRFLSDALPLPAYLEPGRKEGGLASRVAVAFHSRWDLELGGGGDIVRYGPDEWKALDRYGLNAHTALTRHGLSGSARLALLVGHNRFSWDDETDRQDTRLGLGADWSLEGRVVVRLSAAVAWNSSRLAAYDYRSGRVAVMLSAPWWGGTVQGYGAHAHRNYLNPGPEDARVAPSDHHTGSILAVQMTRPVITTHAVTFRLEWSRSETGIRNDFYQRFGFSIQMSLRGLGAY